MNGQFYERRGRRPGRGRPGGATARAPKIWGDLQFDIRAIADAIGYPAAGLGILIESAGIPFPGEAMLLAVAAHPAQGPPDIPPGIALPPPGARPGAHLRYRDGCLRAR